MTYTIECIDIFVTLKEDGYFQGSTFSKGGFIVGTVDDPTPAAVMTVLNSAVGCGLDPDFLFIDETNPELFQVSVIEDADATPDSNGDYLANYVCLLVCSEYIALEVAH